MNFAILERNRTKAHDLIIPNGVAPGTANTIANKMNRGAILIDNAHFVTPEGKTLVAGITFRVEAGERLAVVGPNGAGKTTLLKLLFGRVIPSVGSVKIDGVPIHLMPPLERARTIAVVAGGKNILADMPISWGTTSWEDIAIKDPQFLILLDYQDGGGYQKLMDFLKSHPAMKETAAVKNARFIPLRYEELTPGPANIDAVEKLAKALYPDAFK